MMDGDVRTVDVTACPAGHAEPDVCPPAAILEETSLPHDQLIDRAVYGADLELLRRLLNAKTLGEVAELEAADGSGASGPFWRVRPPRGLGGWAPLHHLVRADWEEGLEYYAQLATELGPEAKVLMMNVLTEDRVMEGKGTSSAGFCFIKGQDATFMAEEYLRGKSLEKRKAWLATHGCMSVDAHGDARVDGNGQAAAAAAQAAASAVETRANLEAVRRRLMVGAGERYRAELRKGASRFFAGNSSGPVPMHRAEILAPFFGDAAVSPITSSVAAELRSDFPPASQAAREQLEKMPTCSDASGEALAKATPSDSSQFVCQIDFSQDPRITAFLDELAFADKNGGKSLSGEQLLDVSRNVVSRIAGHAKTVSEAEGAARSNPVSSSSSGRGADGVAAIAEVALQLVEHGKPWPNGEPTSHTARFRVASSGLQVHTDDSRYTLSIQAADLSEEEEQLGGVAGGELVLPAHGAMVKPRKYRGVFFTGHVWHMVRHFHGNGGAGAGLLKRNLVIWWH